MADVMCFSAKVHPPHQWRCADGTTECPGREAPMRRWWGPLTVAEMKDMISAQA